MLKDELPEIKTKTLPGPKAAAILQRRARAVPAAISCIYPVVIDRGEGAMLEDVDGNRFLDWVGGVGVLNIGYSRPEVVQAVKRQADRYFHGMFNIVTHEGYVALAEKLSALAPVTGRSHQAYFTNSGAEADENAVKIAKAYTKRSGIICFSGAFHGRTNLTMALTSKKAYAIDMGPFPDGIYRAPYPYLYRKPTGMTDDQAYDYYIEQLKLIFEQCAPARDIAAMILEPLQGEGGFVPAPIRWVKAVRKICDENGILLIADEVQSGFCRTGRMFASDYWDEAGIRPDILTTAKSIAGGVPLSAIVADKTILDRVAPGVIGGTFGGNALACAAALKVIEVMEQEDFAGRARTIGEKIRRTYTSWKDRFPVIGDVRGLGAMIGLELVTDRTGRTPDPQLVTRVIREAVQNGLILESAGVYGNVIRFLAPLVITDEQLDCGLRILESAIAKSIRQN
ncbi:MAG: 4-aminobutyrate--2-oxoglutarate transaminase [Oscillospiraceae bacterium]|jgi:4-aminobutyrate aminotransferase/(S)-3-amino-2-methylpropionate transaminase|nr:4-aminobutyrate--2-oxoglutarate transaminase [Oscillospiraceae bacterium]MCI1991094.1 4-aminobutyrate--2-oxoglutarate transaminase [Oscillospiraceae bacterium]MCI2036318.1 4-aminobutyrate--2-oxoglutarate transaminase [Oscillospiraceae bacterium]